MCTNASKNAMKHYHLKWREVLYLTISWCSLVAGAWTERKKIFHGGSFLKLADDNMDIQNPEAQNRELSGFWEKVIFLPFPHEKTTFQWPKVVSEAIFPTNRGYICIEKWSQIFVSGIGSVHSESEEKSLFKLKKGIWIYSVYDTGEFFTLLQIL